MLNWANWRLSSLYELMPLSEKTSKVIKKHKSKPQVILPIFTFQKSAKINLTFPLSLNLITKFRPIILDIRYLIDYNTAQNGGFR